MTNLIATIIITISTNWTTIAETRPTIPNGADLWTYGNVSVVEHQAGIVSSNVVAVVEWAVPETRATIKRRVTLTSVTIKELSRQISHKLRDEWVIEL